jgi:hypothetical protein
MKVFCSWDFFLCVCVCVDGLCIFVDCVTNMHCDIFVESLCIFFCVCACGWIMHISGCIVTYLWWMHLLLMDYDCYNAFFSLFLDHVHNFHTYCAYQYVVQIDNGYAYYSPN